MPKARKGDGEMKTVQITIKVGKKGTSEYKEFPAQYQAPENDVEFQELISSLQGSSLTLAHANYIRGLDLHTRATDEASSAARVSGIVPVYTMKDSKGAEVDLRTMPLAKLISGINASFAGFGKVAAPVRHTRTWLLTQKKAIEKDGVLVASK